MLQFQGTTPANPKDPEGDVWIDESAESTDSATDDASESEAESTEEVPEATTVASNN